MIRPATKVPSGDQPSGITISADDYKFILTHVSQEYPLEACGLLAGREGKIGRVYPIKNQLASPTAYEMDPKEQIRAMLDMEADGFELLGIYHSHPNGPEIPSETDINLATYPDTAYIIVSLQDHPPTTRAFFINTNRLLELSLQIE